MSTEENTPNNKIITIDTLKHYHDEMVENTLTWNNVANKPSAFTPDNHGSDKVTAMTSYSKPSTITDENLPISTSDSLNSAVGKLEYKADNALVLAGNNSDRLDDVDAIVMPNGEILSYTADNYISGAIPDDVRKVADSDFTPYSGTIDYDEKEGFYFKIRDGHLGQKQYDYNTELYNILHTNLPSTGFTIWIRCRLYNVFYDADRESFVTIFGLQTYGVNSIRLFKNKQINFSSFGVASNYLSIVNERWIDICATVDGNTVANPKQLVYLDAVLRSSKNITNPTNLNYPTMTLAFRGGNYNEGKIDLDVKAIKVWSRPLTAGEVAGLTKYFNTTGSATAKNINSLAYMSDYVLPSSTPDPINIQITDSLKTALGKLEYKANNALVNIGEVDTKVDNIKVGGRNLLLDTVEKNATDSLSYQLSDFGVVVTSYNIDKRFLVSFDVECSVENSSISVWFNSTTTKVTQDINFTINGLSKNIIFYSSSVTRLNTSDIVEIKIKNNTTGNTITVKNIKLEEGNQATTYTPAPEDTELAKLRSYSKPSSTSAIATTDTIKSAIGKLEVKADSALPLAGGTMTGTINSQSIIPVTNDVYNLGAANKKFANSYVDHAYVGVLFPNHSSSSVGGSSNYMPGAYITTTHTNAIIEKTTDAGITFTGDILPNTTETYDLGSSTKQFDNLYAKTIYQNGTALATVATSGSYADLSNIPSTFTPASHTHVSNDITSLDASKLTGTISLDRLPHGALEQLVKVADQTARFALTTSEVQNGDTVQQLDTGVMYIVVDQTKLSQAAGYVEYTAGSATSVPWSGVTNKPSFGNTAGTFCEGNDSRLSDARTPTEHAHPYLPLAGGEMEGNISPKLSGSNLTLGENSKGWNYVYTNNIKGTSTNGLILDSNMVPSGATITVGTSTKPFSSIYANSFKSVPSSGNNYSQVDPTVVTVHEASSSSEATVYSRAYGYTASNFYNGEYNYEVTLGTSTISGTTPKLEISKYDNSGLLNMTGRFVVDNITPGIEFSHGSNTSGIYYDFLTPGSEGFSVSGHWNPYSNNAVDLGSTSFKWKSFYTYEVNMYSSGTQNIQMAMSSDSTPVPQILFTNGSNTVALQALAASSASAILTIKGSFRPEANNTRSLGSDSLRWSYLYCTTVVSGTVRPFSNASGSLGTSSYYYSTAYVNNIVTNLSTSAIRPSVTQNGSVGTATYEWLSMYSKDIYQGGQRVLDESSIEEITNSEIDALFDAASISGNSEYSVATTSDLTSIFHDA